MGQQLTSFEFLGSALSAVQAQDKAWQGWGEAETKPHPLETLLPSLYDKKITLALMQISMPHPPKIYYPPEALSPPLVPCLAMGLLL